MSTRDALTARIRFLNERIDRLQVEIAAAKSERAGLIAERDALTDDEAAKVDRLADAGIVKVQP